MTTASPASEPLFDDDFLQQLEVLYLTAQRISKGSQQAQRRSKKLGSGVDIADFRPYVRGDEIRDIDWNYYASTRELLIRLFEKEEDLHIYFLLDHSPSMLLGDGRRFRYAARLSAALSYIGLSNLDRVSIVPFSSTIGTRLPPARGRAQIWKVLRFIEEIKPGKATDFMTSMKTFANSTTRRGLAIIISDFYSHSELERALNILRYRRFETILIQLCRQSDRTPSIHGETELRDCETGHTSTMRVTPDIIARYQQAYDAHMDELQSIAARHQSLYFRAPIERPFEDMVLRVLRAGGLIR